MVCPEAIDVPLAWLLTELSECAELPWYSKEHMDHMVPDRERTPNWLRWANSEVSFPTL